MSIIYDALKKVEAKVSLSVSHDAAEVKMKKPLNVKLLVICGLVACVGIGIAHLIFSAVVSTIPDKVEANRVLPVAGVVKQPAPITPSTQVPQASGAGTQPVVETEPPAEESPQLVLNGVFFSEDGGYALVNNKIISQGEEINGAKVTQITQEEVVFDFKGKEIRLSTRK
ncbi:MAG TPA: general secretion pathway protein GspB [Candidatus Omnitrophota bacterium]|nr:general secretion pathway protein GspB [Candidatus Omnitrophota bacterium]